MPQRGRSYLTDCHFFFVTTTVINFLNVFQNTEACDILINQIKHYQLKYRYEIIAYVIMPSHFHWIVEVNPEHGTVSDIMRDIKKYSAWEILEMIEKIDPKSKIYFKDASRKYPDQKRIFWMKRFDDEVIRNQEMLWSRINYIHNNPVEKELVEKIQDYKYSSARNYYYNDHSIIKVNTELAGIQLR